MSADSFGWDDYTALGHIPGGKNYDWHVLAEGDSWFNLGFNPLSPEFFGGAKNLLEALDFKKSTVIANLALSGDTIKHIADLKANQNLPDALDYRRWHLILISAGGNDLIDALIGDYKIEGAAIEILKKSVPSSHFMEYINTIALESLLNYIETYYFKISELRNTIGSGKNKDAIIIVHCYDYIVARNAPARFLGFKLGPWAHKAFKAYQIPQNNWKLITDYLFNRLAERLSRLPNKIPNFAVVNTLGTLHLADPNEKGNSNDWANEIHPNPDGYSKLAEKKVMPFIAQYLP